MSNIKHTGLDELRTWLEEQGFKVYKNSLGKPENECNWQAFRRTSLPCSECETNDGKPVQLAVSPYAYEIMGRRWEYAEIELTGEADGHWFNLSAYRMKPEELKAKLEGVEKSLVAAWNALSRGKQ